MSSASAFISIFSSLVLYWHLRRDIEPEKWNCRKEEWTQIFFLMNAISFTRKCKLVLYLYLFEIWKELGMPYVIFENMSCSLVQERYAHVVTEIPYTYI